MGLGRAVTTADLDRLSGLVPAMARLSREKISRLQSRLSYYEAPEGTVVVCYGDASDAAYFILEGEVVAGVQVNEQYRVFTILKAGDFFGEIAALTGSRRTADVMTNQPTKLIKVPAAALREMSEDPDLRNLLVDTMSERLLRSDLVDVTLPGRYDQQALRQLRQVPDTLTAPV